LRDVTLPRAYGIHTDSALQVRRIDEHSFWVRRLIRKLAHPLLLLVLIAGGQVSIVMAAPMLAGGETAAKQMPMACDTCDAMDMTAGPCDAACIALAAIETPAVDIATIGSRQTWILQPRSGPTQSVPPDTSPPRS
jgi:hypothetical protein